jgi:putative transposase
VEELLAERGIAVSYEPVRRWCRKFGATFADRLRRRRCRPGDKWHLDEVQLKINGRKHWLWRAVDQAGVVLDILVQQRRNQEAAEAFLRRLVDGQGYRPRVVITDKLASYPPALRRVLPGAEHRRHKRPNNRVEHSHRPTRRRKRALQRFKSPEHAQQLLRSLRPDQRPLPPPPPPAPSTPVPPNDAVSLRGVARGHGPAGRCLSSGDSLKRALRCHSLPLAALS